MIRTINNPSPRQALDLTRGFCAASAMELVFDVADDADAMAARIRRLLTCAGHRMPRSCGVLEGDVSAMAAAIISERQELLYNGASLILVDEEAIYCETADLLVGDLLGALKRR